MKCSNRCSAPLTLLPTDRAMTGAELITDYFRTLSDEQIERYQLMGPLYAEWNDKINVVSRKDIGNIYPNHILHSLAIAKYLRFAPGSEVLDFGCGGGFPSMPLAVMFPEVKFHLVDRVGKKLHVAADVASRLGLNNITVQHGDIREVKGNFDFIVSRAVMRLDEMLPLLRRLIAKPQRNALPNGIICLKGGELADEIKNVRSTVEVVAVVDFFSEPYFKEKKIVYVPIIK